MPDDDEPDADPGKQDPQEHRPEGLDLAQQITAATAAGGDRVRRRAEPRAPRTQERAERASDRDPRTVDAEVSRLVEQRGWELPLRMHGVFARWEELVGAEIAGHSRPETFTEGKLVVRTDSTAWATQLRLLAPQLLRRLNEELGHGTILVIEVVGPKGPSWKRGRLSVRDGRGPRDTYG